MPVAADTTFAAADLLGTASSDMRQMSGITDIEFAVEVDSKFRLMSIPHFYF